MFKHLTNFGYKRTSQEAVGFYLAYLISVILLSMLAGGVSGLAVNQQDNFYLGVRIGTIISILFSVVISLLILNKKKMMGNFGYLLLVIVSGIAAYFGGGILGLIIPAYLSTQ